MAGILGKAATIATIPLLAVLTLLALGELEDRNAEATADPNWARYNLAARGVGSATCDQDAPCRVVRYKGNETVHECKEHRPEPRMIENGTADITIDFHTDEIKFAAEPNYVTWFTEEDMICTDFVIATSDGKELHMDLEGDSIVITGDADMNEAAELFFNGFMKDYIDEYIRSKLQ